MCPLPLAPWSYTISLLPRCEICALARARLCGQLIIAPASESSALPPVGPLLFTRAGVLLFTNQIISRDGSRLPAVRKPAEGQARAKFNFHAQSAIELSLSKGELVGLTRRVDDNWFEGRIANRKGIFPVSYVDVSVPRWVEWTGMPSSLTPLCAHRC